MTDYQTYLDKIKNLQTNFLKYLDDVTSIEENYQNLIEFINNQKIPKDHNEFRLILHFVNIISNNHDRCNDFFGKIEKILLIFKKEFQNYLSNDEIFHIFNNNNRILLFLFKDNIIQMNQELSNIIVHDKVFINYFFKEISPYIDENLKKQIEEENKDYFQNSMEFDLNRQKGVNEQKICEIIQKDDIDSFISHISRTNLSLQTTIKRSIFETNLFLNSQKSDITFIEYSAFYGSIQIFKYLCKNDIELTPSLWLYSIHGRNPEIFLILIENKVKPKDQSYKECIIEAIKSHHNEIVDYISNNFSQHENNTQFINSISIDYYNFSFIQNEIAYNESNFYKFCKYDYYFFIQQFIKNINIDINFRINDTINNHEYLFTPLNVSIFYNNENIALLLLKQQNIDPNIEMIKKKWTKSDKSMNSLVLSIKMKKIKLVKQLLFCKNIDVNKFLSKTKYFGDVSKISYLYTPLAFAIKNKQTKVVELLLSYKNINLNYILNVTLPRIDYIKHNALSLAMNCIEIVKMLLSHDKIDVNFHSKIKFGKYESNDPPLRTAIRANNVEIVKLLLSHPKINVNNYSYKTSEKENIKKKSLLECAIKMKNIEIINLLLSNNSIDVNLLSFCKLNNIEEKKSSLHYTIIKNDIEILKILISHENIDINLLMDKKTDDMLEKFPPLYLAVKEGTLETLKLLISHKNDQLNDICISEDSSSYAEKSALYFAVENNKKEIVEFLSSCSNIDVNFKYKYNSRSKIKCKVILHEAIKMGNYDIINILLNNKKIDINAISYSKKNQIYSEEEKSTLYYAIKYGNIKIVQLLLEIKEIDLNLTFKKLVFSQGSFFIDQNSAIQFALFKDSKDIFEFILNHLMKNKKLSKDLLKELLIMTKNNEIKSLIYKHINE